MARQNLDIIAIKETLAARAYPIQRRFALRVPSCSDNKRILQVIQTAWKHFSSGYVTPSYSDFISLLLELEIGTCNTSNITFLKALHPSRRLLIQVDFDFTYSYSPPDYRPLLSSLRRKRPLPPQNSVDHYGDTSPQADRKTKTYITSATGLRFPNPYLVKYTGHDATPGIALSHQLAVLARRR